MPCSKVIIFLGKYGIYLFTSFCKTLNISLVKDLLMFVSFSQDNLHWNAFRVQFLFLNYNTNKVNCERFTG